jgi:hypothetical protein
MALADIIAVFDAATTEEARRRQAEGMGERWCAEWERLRMERELHYREQREAMQQRRREALEQQLREEAVDADFAAW